jgi:predicted ATPase
MNDPSSNPRLYGRNSELGILRDAYLAVSTAGGDDADSSRTTTELVLVAGPAGTGKRALVQTLQLQTTTAVNSGYFLSGSFRQRPAKCPQQQAPFAGLREAVEAVLDTLHSQEQKEAWKDSLLSEFTSEGDVQLLTETFPSLQWLLEADTVENGNENSTHTTKTTTITTVPLFGKHSLQWHQIPTHCAILCRFLHTIGGSMPLVLVLENVQWADAASLDLLQALLVEATGKECSTKGLLIVATYRNDVELTERFSAFLQDVVESSWSLETRASVHGQRLAASRLTLHSSPRHGRIHSVELKNLSRKNVNEWIVERFGRACSKGTTHSLTNIVYDHTAGNPLFIHYLLLHLNRDGALEQIDVEKLDGLRSALPKRIEDLFGQMIACTMPFVQNVLKTAAAVGELNDGVIDCQTLEKILQQPCADAILVAQDDGWLEFVGGRLRFTRQEIRAAAYSLIPKSDRSAFHLKIGRRLWKYSPLIDDDDTNLQLITRQLRQGVDLVTDSDERFVIAKLGFRAGQMSMRASAFDVAANYIDFAISTLGDGIWKGDRYDTSLALYNCGAEAYYCTGDFDGMNRMLSAVFDNAMTFQDKLQAYTVFVYSNGARHRLQEAMMTAFEVLRKLGEPIPANPGKIAVLVSYLKTRWMLAGKSDRFFLNLPVAKDADKIAAMQMLNFASWYAHVVKPECSALATFRLIRLTVQQGLTGVATTAFSSYGVLLSAAFGNAEEGYRYGQLSLAMLEQLDARAWLPRVYVGVYGFNNQWVHPFRESREPLQLAHRSALKTGDMEGSALAAYVYLIMSFHAGIPLGDLEQDARAYCQTMASFSQTMGLLFALPYWSFVCGLSGNSACLLSGEVRDGESAFNRAVKEGNKVAISQCYINRAVACCFRGDYRDALDMAHRSHKMMKEKSVSLCFYEGLSFLVVAQTATGRSRRQYERRGRKHTKILKDWARKCPANFLNKQALLEAELAVLKGEIAVALSWYNQSIETAAQEGFVHEEALAFERLGQYQCSLGNLNIATPYFDRARDLYKHWGAITLVDRMEELGRTKYSPTSPV